MRKFQRRIMRRSRRRSRKHFHHKYLEKGNNTRFYCTKDKKSFAHPYGPVVFLSTIEKCWRPHTSFVRQREKISRKNSKIYLLPLLKLHSDLRKHALLHWKQNNAHRISSPPWKKPSKIFLCFSFLRIVFCVSHLENKITINTAKLVAICPPWCLQKIVEQSP